MLLVNVCGHNILQVIVTLMNHNYKRFDLICIFKYGNLNAKCEFKIHKYTNK